MTATLSDSRAAKRELLHGVPMIRPGVQLSESNAGTLALEMTIERGDGFFDMFRPARTQKRYELDEFGTFVVRHMNGGRTVKEIIDDFQRRFGMSHRECELGVVAFLKMLVHRRAASVTTVPEA